MPVSHPYRFQAHVSKDVYEDIQQIAHARRIYMEVLLRHMMQYVLVDHREAFLADLDKTFGGRPPT